MADLVFTKNNHQFYYCEEGKGATPCSIYSPYMVRWNSVGTSSWVRSSAFTTGDYDVSSITITINDMDTRYQKQGSPTFGISTIAQNYPSGTSLPSLLWSDSDTTNSIVNGYNTYSVTLNVDMKARTEYYLYLFTQGSNSSSSLAWQCLTHPSSSSSSRATKVELIFNSKSYSANTYEATPIKGFGINTVSGYGNYAQNTSVTFTATTLAGYDFLNWSDEGDLILSTDSSYTFLMPASNITYIANAALKTYTIEYKKDSYSIGTEISDLKTYGTDIQLKGELFTRTNYVQTGWTTVKNGAQTHNLSEIYKDNNNLTLYPVWTAGVASIEYNPGDYGTGNIIYETKTNDIDITLKDIVFTRIGYEQTAWTDGVTIYELNSVYSKNTALILTPVWTPITYQVSYNSNGATSGSMSNSTHIYDKLQNLNDNAFIKSNYNFTGWKDELNNKTYVNKESVKNLTADKGRVVNLTAQRSSAVYTIKFNLNGGSSSTEIDDMKCQQGITYYIPSKTITRANYIFLGWSRYSTATTATYTAGDPIKDLGNTGDEITLYAVWKVKTINITYHINNGTQTYTKVVTYNTTSSTNKFATLPSGWGKTDYEALGWNISAGAMSPRYYFNESFSGDLGLEDGANLDLYVIWSPINPWTLTTIVWKINGKEYKF